MPNTNANLPPHLQRYEPPPPPPTFAELPCEVPPEPPPRDPVPGADRDQRPVDPFLRRA